MSFARNFGWFRRQKIAAVLLLSIFVVVGASQRAEAQVTTATLSGSVVDTDKAIIPGAQVTLTNRNNRFTRTVKSNGSGDFSFASIQFGDYDVIVSFPGFQKYQITNIHLNPGDSRTLIPFQLKPGASDVVVNVNANSQNAVSDSGERSSTISADTINKLTLQSREVTELLKILPGSAISTGNAGNQSAVSNSAFDNSNTQLGGATSGYAMSGSPQNGVSIRSDGANLTDPATFSGSLQNINPDTTEEVKVEQQNFGADTANGPLVINAVSKSGGTVYHGSIYVNARTSGLNANDAFAKELGQNRPPDRFIYPGATFGGPVLIPHTNFNHNKRLTFFLSGEDLVQKNTYAYGNVASALQTALVPTAAMRQGDFSVAQLQKYLPPGSPICAANPNNGPAVCNGSGPTLGMVQSTTYANISVVPISGPNGQVLTCNGNTGNDCLSAYLDPGAVAQFKLIPLPNTPNGQTTTGAYNYIARNLVDNDLWNAHGKLDYKPNEHNTFALSYNAEFGKTFIPQATGYYASGNSGGILTPGGTNRTEHTHSGSFNWTDVFNGTTTNEFFLNGTYSDHIDTPGNPSKLFDSAIGYPYTGAYANGTKQYPTFTDYGYDGLPVGVYPDYSFGSLFSRTLVPGLGDNLTKVIRRHTLKLGVNVERPSVNGTLNNVGNSPTNGAISNYYTAPTYFLPSSPGSTAPPLTYHSTCYSASDPYCAYSGGANNQLANYLTGAFSSYQQANIVPRINLLNWSTSFYINDDYKVTSRLTVQVGLRFEHLGRWQDQHGQGAAVWRPDLYAGDPVNSTTLPLPGFRWHGIDKTVPLGGWDSRLFFYEPRAGFTYDLYGNGKTTVSGGWGQYRFHEGQSDFQNTLTTTNGLRTVTVNNPYSNAGLRMSYVDQLNLSPSASNTFLSTDTNYPTTTTSNIYGVKQGDTESPLTTTYSFTVTQQMPKDMVFSIGYAGNQSKYLLNDGANQQIFVDNVNALPVGSLFQPDPNPGSKFYGITYTAANIQGIGASQQNDYRPYPHYGTIQVLAHTLYSNYNALQVTLNRNKGILSYGINYTFSKALGVRGSYANGIPGDSFNLRNDYGVQSYDRTHIFNTWYDFNEGVKFHGNRVLRGVLNGYEVSGYFGIQSGPDLQATNYVSNFGLNGSIAATANQNSYNVSNITFLGTPDVSLQPKLTCNPSTNLRKGQYLNAACFQLPAQGGDNGQFIYPYAHGPAYLNTDITAIKNFKISDTKNFQIRVAGFNFLNHPLPTFSNKAPQALQLQFQNGQTINRNLFGQTTYETGRRQVEIGTKYTF